MIRFPSTRLGRLARAKTRQEAMEHCNIYYDKLVPEYFFDRNPENFSSILGEYQILLWIRVLDLAFCENFWAKTCQEAMEHCNIYYDKLVPEYFFDWNPENFSPILGEYQILSWIRGLDLAFYESIWVKTC